MYFVWCKYYTCFYKSQRIQIYLENVKSLELVGCNKAMVQCQIVTTYEFKGLNIL